MKEIVVSRNIKKIVGIALATLPVVMGVGFLSNVSDSSVSASSTHVCSGNHYLGKEATFSESGYLEYWVCCECHEHFYTEPDAGTWVDVDGDPSLDSRDERYIPALIKEVVPTEDEIIETHIVPAETSKDEPTVVDQNGDDTGLIIKEIGQTEDYSIVGYKGTSSTVIIPEGIKEIDTWNNHPFNGQGNSYVSNIETVVIPESVEKVSVIAFQNMPNLTTIVIASERLEYGCIENCPNLKSIYITKNVKFIDNTPFITTGSQDIKIFCEATSKPSGWTKDWNVRDWSGHMVNGQWDAYRYDTTWGVAY